MVNIQNLGFAYKNKGNLFSGLNLELSPGNIYGLLGKNGVGKTTLLKIISGLLFSQKGICEVTGKKSKDRSADFLQEIYFIPEEFYTPTITIKEYEALYSPFYPRFDKSGFHNYNDEFKLSGKDLLSSLSYGQKKKFMLSFGLATGSRILIMDEPTNGLDIPTKSQFRKLIASSITDDRIFIISTHQVRDMENLIDPIIILENGKIIFQQNMEEISSKLLVILQQKEPLPGEFFYYDRVPGGFSVIKENKTGEDSKIDLEILFNAVISNWQEINSLFNKEGKI